MSPIAAVWRGRHARAPGFPPVTPVTRSPRHARASQRATRSATADEKVVYVWADGVARMMNRDDHFFMDEKKNKIELTDKAKHLVRYSNPPVGEHSCAASPAIMTRPCQ